MVRLEREMAMSALVQVGKTTPLDGTSRACERLRMAADLESGHRVVSSFWQRAFHRRFLLALWTGEFLAGLSAIFKSLEFLATIHLVDSRRSW
jgi:hypothetical protein